MRSVFFNVFQSVIVLLYVLDNETNTLIKVSCFVGLGIEIWKIQKVVDVSIDPENSFLGIFPKLLFKDKGSYEESGTKEFDRMAFKYLGWSLFPLAVGYCIYSVIYNEHKSWYSFVLSSIYGFLLTFGKSNYLSKVSEAEGRAELSEFAFGGEQFCHQLCALLGRLRPRSACSIHRPKLGYLKLFFFNYP